MLAIEILQTTLAVVVGLFVLRVIQKLLEARSTDSKLGGAFAFLLGA